jgi:hypothetical protein
MAAEERESLKQVTAGDGEAAAAGSPEERYDLAAYLKAMDKRGGESLRKRWEKREKRETMKKRRQAALDLFDGMSSFYRDIMLLNLMEEKGRDAAEAPLLNRELIEELKREALHTGIEEAMRRLETLQGARKALEANADIGLLLDKLVLELKGVNE